MKYEIIDYRGWRDTVFGPNLLEILKHPVARRRGVCVGDSVVKERSDVYVDECNVDSSTHPLCDTPGVSQSVAGVSFQRSFSAGHALAISLNKLSRYDLLFLFTSNIHYTHHPLTEHTHMQHPILYPTCSLLVY